MIVSDSPTSKKSNKTCTQFETRRTCNYMELRAKTVVQKSENVLVMFTSDR